MARLHIKCFEILLKDVAGPMEQGDYKTALDNFMSAPAQTRALFPLDKVEVNILLSSDLGSEKAFKRLLGVSKRTGMLDASPSFATSDIAHGAIAHGAFAHAAHGFHGIFCFAWQHRRGGL